MKRAASLCRILVITVLTVVAASVCAAQESVGPGIEKSYCWRDSQTRGVGTVPTSCAEGQEMVGLLCYDKCSAGMQRAGVDCHSTCPAGFRDDGLFCRRAEYGRGSGYPWRWSDGFSSDGMLNRCKKDNPQLGCEMSGAVAYPSCRPGYTAFGCCICRPSVPDCAREGLGGSLDLSCAKKIEVGQPKLGVCPSGSSDSPGSAQEMDAGLCYASCPAGYKGAGPVCWGQAPKVPQVSENWVECGMGAAKDSATCVFVTKDQVLAVGKLAWTVASAGSNLLGAAGANAAVPTGKVAELKEMYANLMKAYEIARAKSDKIRAAEQAYTVGTNLNKTKNKIEAAQNAAKTIQNETYLAADIIRAGAQITAILDSSGISSTVAAYSYPLCSSYFPHRPPADSLVPGP